MSRLAKPPEGLGLDITIRRKNERRGQGPFYEPCPLNYRGKLRVGRVSSYLDTLIETTQVFIFIFETMKIQYYQGFSVIYMC